MDIDSAIEQTRMLSLLSERYHVVRAGDQIYSCFAGLVLPAELGHVVFLWALVDAKYYSKLLTARMAEIQDLNKSNPDVMGAATAEQLAYYLKDRMQGVMRTWQAEHFEDVLV